jgi:hypothetical protein
VTTTVTFPNVNDGPLGLMIGAMPVPVRGTEMAVGLELAMMSVALRAPATLGRNETLMVQLAPPARLVVQVLVCMKSAALSPVTLMPVIARGPAPAALESVTV